MPRRRKEGNCVPIVSSATNEDYSIHHSTNRTININRTGCIKEKPQQRNGNKCKVYDNF